MRTSTRIWKWLAPYRGWVLLSSVLTAGSVGLNLLAPLTVQRLVDGAVGGSSTIRLAALAATLLFVYAGQAAFGIASSLVAGRVGQGLVRDLRYQVYERLQRLSLSFYDRTPTGSIISRIMDDVGAIQTFVTGQTFTVLTDVSTTIAVTVLLATRNGRMAIVVLCIAPLYAFNFRHFMSRIRTNNRIIRDKMDLLFGHLKEKIDGRLAITAHARERAESAAFLGQLEDVHGPRVLEMRLYAAFSNLAGAIGGIGTAAVFAAGAIEVIHGRMTPGEVVATVALANLLFGPIARLADVAYVFEQAAASVERLGEVLDVEPDVIEDPDPVTLGRAQGLVEYDRVGFGYKQGTPVVWDIRLRVEPGMKVALVGPTGCGKSTLVNLLLRFYDPTWGEIRIDGVPLRRISTTELRRQIGVVLQEPVVFHATVADNIRYGTSDATDADVEAAARAALAHGFITALPDGYRTIVGEGGHKLSQGERQRLAIARAFCRNPFLVVLDEATSSLDTPSETLIQAAMANLLRGRTAFIIAHRLSTIVDADLIVVMDGGLVVQRGTHEQLLADADGLYARLCERQFGAEALKTAGQVADPARRRPPGVTASANPDRRRRA
ncbi:ABC transporter ATP-binding protein [Aquisphaera insulae]|uniref:ABC transporter ATP-binding protein n=1 Tax=Aquisphaera insulae TaxID=2712864 RepID=UPI0013EE3B2B|nr:ABC transporter ATP-binding protein [Aquisphaera insulae]